MAYMDEATLKLLCKFVNENVLNERYALSVGHPTSYRDGKVMSLRESGRDFYRSGDEFHTREFKEFRDLFKMLIETNMLASPDPDQRAAAHNLLKAYVEGTGEYAESM